MSFTVIPVHGTQPQQLPIPSGGGTLANFSTQAVTISTSTQFISGYTFTLGGGGTIPLAAGPIWARTTKGHVVTLILIAGLYTVSTPGNTLKTLGIAGSSNIKRAYSTGTGVLLPTVSGTIYQIWLCIAYALAATKTDWGYFFETDFGTTRSPIDAIFNQSRASNAAAGLHVSSLTATAAGTIATTFAVVVYTPISS